MTSTRKTSVSVFALAAIAGATLFAAAPAVAADAIISGTVKDASGAPMGGVTVSAKAQGSTITTTVFTDEQGAYFLDRKSTRLNSSHIPLSRMPSSA